MDPHLAGAAGNPASVHGHGQAAARVVDAARARVRALCGGPDGDLIFTGSGTEAVLLGTFGAARAASRAPVHAVFSAVEHRSGRDGGALLQALGWTVSWVSPERSGHLAPEAVSEAMREDTAFVSVMHANNETGVVHPVREIAERCRHRGIRMHVDAVQSAGKIPVLAEEWGAEYVSVAAHKLGGPQGTGALWRRRGAPLIPVLPGPQEGGLRGGTLNTAGIVGFGKAAELAVAELDAASSRVRGLRDRLESSLSRRVPAARITAADVPRLPNTVHLTFDPAVGSDLVVALDLAGFAVSAGSACRSGSEEPSPVLLAMGWPADRARTAVRVSLGRETEEADVDAFVETLAGLVAARCAPGTHR